MELYDFEQKLVTEIRNQTGEDTEVELTTIRKNNNVSLRAVLLRKSGISVSPAIYTDQLLREYEKGVPIRHLVRLVLHQFHKTVVKTPDSVDFFSDFQNVRASVYCKLINLSRNQELLREIPFRRWNDLAIVCYYEVDPQWIEGATIQIRTEHLQKWGITEDELIDMAMKNTIRSMTVSFTAMEEMLSELTGAEVCADGFPLYVLTNKTRCLGAVCMTFPGMLKKIAQNIGSSYFILPSSIHEVLIVPADQIREPEGLNAIICEVNETQLEPEDILSDHSYFYDNEMQALITSECAFMPEDIG